jgi:hypothetical protein
MAQTTFVQTEPVEARTAEREAKIGPHDEDNMEVQSLPVAAAQWSVRDPQFPADDARGLLGFVEAHDDGSDAKELSLDPGVNWFSFPSLGDAVAHFASLEANHPEQRTRVSSPRHPGGIL